MYEKYIVTLVMEDGTVNTSREIGVTDDAVMAKYLRADGISSINIQPDETALSESHIRDAIHDRLSETEVDYILAALRELGLTER